MVREMGSPWVVEFFPWAYHEPVEGEFAWRQADLIINHAESQGLTVIARLGLVPDWARPEGTPLNYLEEDAYQRFATYAGAFAEKYAGRVDHIVVLNEPNLSFEWGGRPTTPADYVRLLEVVAPEIRAGNPNAVILAGALAPTLEPEGSPNGLNDLVYLRGMYEAGAGDYFDGLAVHAYGLTFPPEVAPAEDLLNFRRVELLREIMLEFGDDSPIFITESGYNDHPRWTKAVRPSQRINYTIESLAYAEQNWDYVEMMALWMFRMPGYTYNFLDYYTLVTPDFVEKPIYEELARYARAE